MKYILAFIIVMAGFIPILCSPTHNAVDISFFLFTLLCTAILILAIHKHKQKNKESEEKNNTKDQKGKDEI